MRILHFERGIDCFVSIIKSEGLGLPPPESLISNLSDTEWNEESTYTIYAEAYAYSETEKIPWLLGGYAYLK